MGGLIRDGKSKVSPNRRSHSLPDLSEIVEELVSGIASFGRGDEINGVTIIRHP